MLFESRLVCNSTYFHVESIWLESALLLFVNSPNTLYLVHREVIGAQEGVEIVHLSIESRMASGKKI